MQTLRNLARTPGFTLLVIALFALAIGANTAMFGIFNGLFLNSLPFPDPQRLIYLSESAPRFHRSDINFPFADFEGFRGNQTLESIAAFKPDDGANLSTTVDPSASVAQITPGYFRAMGIGIEAGRDFNDDDGSAGTIVVGSTLGTRLLESLLSGVSTPDPWTLLTVGATLMVAVLAANLAPARRAALVDPIRALRSE